MEGSGLSTVKVNNRGLLENNRSFVKDVAPEEYLCMKDFISIRMDRCLSRRSALHTNTAARRSLVQIKKHFTPATTSGMTGSSFEFPKAGCTNLSSSIPKPSIICAHLVPPSSVG